MWSSRAPSPNHFVNTCQFIEVTLQHNPFSLYFPVTPQAIATHELIDLRGAIQHGLHVAGGGLVTVKMFVQAFSLPIELFDKGIDVVLSSRSVQTALVQSRIQTPAEPIGLRFDAVNQLFDLLVADAIWQVDKRGRTKFRTPLPGDVVSIGQQFQIGAQTGPITLHTRIERVQGHEVPDS